MPETDKADSLAGSSFEQLERDFQEVLKELVGDKSLDRFRAEYEKLHRALKKSSEGEARLLAKCRELDGEIAANAARVQTALKLSQEDQQTILSLKREIDKAWRMAEASRDKEGRARETITALKGEITTLSRLVEQSAGTSSGHEEKEATLLTEKQALIAERDLQTEQIAALRASIGEQLQALQGKEAERQQLSARTSQARSEERALRAELEQETRRRERLSKLIKDLERSLALKEKDVRRHRDELEEERRAAVALDHSIKAQHRLKESAGRDVEAAEIRLTNQRERVRTEQEARVAQAAENHQQAIRLKRAEEAVLAKRREVAAKAKGKEQLSKELRSLEAARAELRTQIETVASAALTIEHEVALERRETASQVRAREGLVAELATLQKALRSVGDSTREQLDLSKVHAEAIRSLEEETGTCQAEAAQQKKAIQQLERSRARFGAEASEGVERFRAAVSQIKVQDASIRELHKTIADGEAKLKAQQDVYEAVRSDRNQYSKSLVETQDDLAEMKRKFKIVHHQVDQLKDEVKAKDQAFIKEHIEHARAQKCKESLKGELGRERKRTGSSEVSLRSLKSELASLSSIIDQAGTEREQQVREYEVALHERDILSTQLVRRNDELALLYEKVKLQQQTLSRGERAYRESREDARLLKLKLNQLRRELHLRNSSCSNIGALENELYLLQKELLQDRTKVRALSEELENPHNRHRWRKLEGSDATTYEMLTKIQALQRRLIAKTEEAVERDLLIAEKDKLYVECKNILARQPGPEVAEQLSAYQQALRDKTRSMKAVASELNMLQSQIPEYKYEMERMTRELQETKRRYYETKRRENLQRERAAPVPPLLQQQPSPALTHVTS